MCWCLSVVNKSQRKLNLRIRVADSSLGHLGLVTKRATTVCAGMHAFGTTSLDQITIDRPIPIHGQHLSNALVMLFSHFSTMRIL